MTSISRLALLLLSLWSLLGCNSTGVGNPGADMTVTVINDLTVEPQATGDAEQLADSQLRHAVLAFSEIRFLPCDLADAEVAVPGPFVIDLVSGKIDLRRFRPSRSLPMGSADSTRRSRRQPLTFRFSDVQFYLAEFGATAHFSCSMPRCKGPSACAPNRASYGTMRTPAPSFGHYAQSAG